jgi:cell division protein FtsB
MFMQRQTLVLLLCCGMTGYFGYHAIHGKHGLEARHGLQERAERLALELKGLETVRSELKREVALLDPRNPDPDFVEELARADLGYARPDERILLETDSRVAALH